jgi:Tol biopolymer transport system component
VGPLTRSPIMPRTVATFGLLLALSNACSQEPAPITEPAAATPSPDPGEPTVLLSEPGVENAYPRLSNDGRRILYQSNRTGSWQLFIMDASTGEQQRLTNDTFNNNFVDWSADNEWVAFVSDRDGNEELYRMRTDGTGLERLTEHPERDIHPYFSPDGKYLLFNSTRDNGSLDVYRLDLATRELLRITDSPMQETCARYSPDMRHIVLLRNGTTSDDVVILDVETKTMSNLTNTPIVIDGWPMYSPDGQWIYYSTMQSGQHSIHRVRPDGSGDEVLTSAAPGEEDGRAFIGSDGRVLIYNKRKDGRIDIRRMVVPA